MRDIHLRLALRESLFLLGHLKFLKEEKSSGYVCHKTLNALSTSANHLGLRNG